MLSVFDVARYILSKTGKISTMKLQKLAYYCQAWSLVWDEEPLFKENIEAWANGPVVRVQFEHLRCDFHVKEIKIGNRQKLNNKQKATIDAVLAYYGRKSAQWLIELSRKEEPWKKAREGLQPLERGKNVISLDSIAEYYSSL